ncbi:hypothetical protein B0T18DRAFT_422024 [Schizothecium vesticola]|uniref:Uncharacterized protein n=1 Tax=Schizothecium vesticola TaxID=314040 RepID=A0AA40BQG9_9PEZI|nr:hypothetical protein B0T18DRAFT_422024 [Schizothecium vesticola]
MPLISRAADASVVQDRESSWDRRLVCCRGGVYPHRGYWHVEPGWSEPARRAMHTQYQSTCRPNFAHRLGVSVRPSMVRRCVMAGRGWRAGVAKRTRPKSRTRHRHTPPVLARCRLDTP